MSTSESKAPSKSIAALSLAAGIATLVCPIAVAASGAPNVIQGRTGAAALAWLIGLGVCLGVIAFTVHARRAARREPAKFAGAGLAVGGLVVTLVSVLCLFGLIPLSFVVRREVDRQVAVGACAENLMAVGRALQGYAIDHGNYPETLLGLRGILRRPERLWCAGDTNRAPAFSWDSVAAANISFELLRPGGTEQENLTNTVIRCPVHGLELLGSGKLHHSRPQTGTGTKTKGGQ